MYYLKHHFDPDFDFHNLKPVERANGSMDHFNLGFVKNVVPGDLLAEWVKITPENMEKSKEGKATISANRTFPSGENVAVDTADPGRLLASAKGYPYYDPEGRISVKTLLNVRSDVDLRTGNIHFLGNVVIHGDVRTGYQVLGGNVLVRGFVDGAQLRAEESLVTESGVKGAGQGVLKAAQDIRVPFAENVTLMAGRKLQVETACLHCRIYAGRQLAVRGRLVGGTTWCTSTIFVGDSLGGPMATETEIVLGYDASLMHRAHVVETRIKESLAQIKVFKEYAARGEDVAEEYEPKIKALEARVVKFRDKRRQLWNGITSAGNVETCRLVVPGVVHPGVEIFMGTAYLPINDEMRDVCFCYKDGDIVPSSPAMKGKRPNC